MLREALAGGLDGAGHAGVVARHRRQLGGGHVVAVAAQRPGEPVERRGAARQLAPQPVQLAEAGERDEAQHRHHRDTQPCEAAVGGGGAQAVGLVERVGEAPGVAEDQRAEGPRVEQVVERVGARALRQRGDRLVERGQGLGPATLRMVDDEGPRRRRPCGRHGLPGSGVERRRELVLGLVVAAGFPEQQREHHMGRRQEAGVLVVQAGHELARDRDRAVVEAPGERGGAQQAHEHHGGPPAVAAREQLPRGRLHRRERAEVVGAVEEQGRLREHRSRQVRPGAGGHGPQPVLHGRAPPGLAAPHGREGGDRRGEVAGGEVVAGRGLGLADRLPCLGRPAVQVGAAGRRPGRHMAMQRRPQHAVVPAPARPPFGRREERAPLLEERHQRGRVLAARDAGRHLGAEPVEVARVLEEPGGRLGQGIDDLAEQVIEGIAAGPRRQHEARHPALGLARLLGRRLGRRVRAERHHQLAGLLRGERELRLGERHRVRPGATERPGERPPGRDGQARPGRQLAGERRELGLAPAPEEQVGVVDDDHDPVLRPGRDLLAEGDRAALGAHPPRQDREAGEAVAERRGERIDERGPAGARVARDPGRRRVEARDGLREQRGLAVAGPRHDAQQARGEPLPRRRHEAGARQARPRQRRGQPPSPGDRPRRGSRV